MTVSQEKVCPMRALVCLFVILLISSVNANEWRQFRGPGGQGLVTDAKNLPETWSETENILWKAELPGRGWSSPVFAGSTIWLTTAVEHPLEGEALEKARSKKLFLNPLAKEMDVLGSVVLHAIGINPQTGAVEKDIELFTLTEIEPVHSLNSSASPTPILDGEFLYCHFGEMGTACVNTADGTIVWKTQLPSKHSVGPGSSPVIYNDLLIVPCDGTDQQYVVALNKLTGEQVWKTKRPKMTGILGELHKAFSTPLLVKTDERDQVIVPGAQWVVAYDPRDGYEIWRVRYGDGFSNVPRPVAGHGMVYVCTGYTSPQLWAIALDGHDDVTKTHVKFKIAKQVPTMPSPILVDDQLYFVSDGGVATSADALKGETIWTKRLAGNYSSSPLFADGKLYFSSREGKTTVIRPGRTYEEVAVNSLDGQLMASPAVYEDSLLLRSQSHLYRITKK
jgi:outer membrane protein assembly factor BamB